MSEENKIAPKKKGASGKKTDTKVMAKTDKSAPAARERTEKEITMSFITALAKDKNYPVDKLKMLMEMKNKQEDRDIAEQKRQSELRFMEDFAIMQREFKPVIKTKKNKQHNSTYAGISDLQRQYGPIISKNGFAMDFAEPEFKEDGSVICCFILMKHGHKRVTKIVMPKYEPAVSSTGGSIMNPMQAVGTQLSYGNRYAMKAGLGVTEEDEDTDGNLTVMDGAFYPEVIKAIMACNTKEAARKKTTEKIEGELKDDEVGQRVAKDAYKYKCKQLNKAGVNQ